MSKAYSILELWESSNTLGIAHGRGKGRGKPEFNIFGVIGEENRIDSVEEGVAARHVETLGGTEVVDALNDSLAVYCE